MLGCNKREGVSVAFAWRCRSWVKTHGPLPPGLPSSTWPGPNVLPLCCAELQVT